MPLPAERLGRLVPRWHYDKPMHLSATELRVLGALMEKEISTPEYYPLSLNGLVAAANQKSSREPVMSLSEVEVRAALASLEDQELVSVDHGSRVQRYEHRARTVFHLRRDETALVCLLLLRGPQTPGELRSRADRLHNFEDLEAVVATLARLGQPTEQRSVAMVVQLSRQPGAKEMRYAHTLGDPASFVSVPQVASSAGSSADGALKTATLADRVAHLEAEVERLCDLLKQLQQRLDADLGR